MVGDGAFIEGLVKIPRERTETWLPLLRDLYRFESSRVAGPGSNELDIGSVIWSLEEAREALDLNQEGLDNLEDLVSFLDEKRQVMRFPESQNRPDKFLTRIADTVRNLGHTYEYWHRGRAGVTATRWLVENKQIPRRTIPFTDFRDEIVSKLEEWLPEHPRNLNHLIAAREVCEAVAKSLAKEYGIGVSEILFSDFQLQSTLRILESRYGPERGTKAHVLTAGVGSGKTIGFSIATLIEARRSMLAANNDPDLMTTSLFIYPRTQLAKDQHSQISSFASQMNCDLETWFEHSTTYKEMNLPTTYGVQREYSANSQAKPVIITTYETLKRRMRRSEFMTKMSKHLSTVVLDEIHLTSGVPGGMASYILSRLSTVSKSEGREIYWIGASATIARPDQHASKLFGIEPDQVGVVDPSPEELVQSGINHHVFIRPNQGMSTLGVLVNATSLLIHQRRDDLSDRRTDDERRQKSIGFADNLEMLGRWNDDLKENERAENALGQGKRTHPKVEDITQWNREQREIPYALRFHKPLQRRLTNWGGDDSDNEGDALANLSNLFDKKESSSVCDKCRSGERVTLGEITPDKMKELSKLVHRHPHREDDKFKAFRINSDVFNIDEPTVIGTHENCPLLKAGACSWFPRPDFEEPFKIHDNAFEFSSAGRWLSSLPNQNGRKIKRPRACLALFSKPL